MKPHDPYAPPGLPPAARREMFCQQAVAKIHWGARDQEVADWLKNEHGFTDAETAKTLLAAHTARRGAIRAKATVQLVCSLLGVLGAGVFFGLQFSTLGTGLLIRPIGSAMVLVLGVLSLRVSIRSLARLLTGRTDGSVD